MASRIGRAVEAVRPQLKARLLIAGPAGAGKTRSALQVATELMGLLHLDGSILMIDTERESALTYARASEDGPGFAFTHLAWDPPYAPGELAETLDDVDATVHPIVVIDSLSHFWNKEGSTLDIAGGKFTGWKDARPIQNEMVDAVLRCRAHTIICGRQKMEYAQETDAKGKHTVTKLGMETIQDDTLEYEVSVTLVMSVDHQMLVSKSRAGDDLPVGRIYQPARGPAEFAVDYAGFLTGGVEMVTDVEADELRAELNRQGGEVRRAWRAAGFPTPTKLARDRLGAAREFLARGGRIDGAPDPTPDTATETAPTPEAPVTDESAPEAENASDPVPAESEPAQDPERAAEVARVEGEIEQAVAAAKAARAAQAAADEQPTVQPSRSLPAAPVPGNAADWGRLFPSEGIRGEAVDAFGHEQAIVDAFGSTRWKTMLCQLPDPLKAELAEWAADDNADGDD